MRENCLSNIDENGNNSYQRATIHRLQTQRNDIDENGLNGLQRAARKTVIKKRCNIDENGLDSFQRAAKKSIQTKLNDIDENGINGLQRASIKANTTKVSRIDENGNNSNQRGALKAIETKRNNIDEDGLDGVQRGTLHALQTVQERYNVDNISQTQEWKDIIHNKRNEINNKIYNTKKKNGTLNSSSDENMIYQFLLYKFEFEDIIYHYKDDKRYQFECDFYIKSLDLFIELNFYWTHGYEQFDPNNIKHIEQLNKWQKCSQDINFKQKKKDGYKNAIYIWTMDDPLKLETFKKNNLNYKIFYNLDEFLDWFSIIS